MPPDVSWAAKYWAAYFDCEYDAETAELIAPDGLEIRFDNTAPKGLGALVRHLLAKCRRDPNAPKGRN